MKKAEHVTIVIFGASGDLTKRKLIPALFQLAKDGLLTEKTTIVGFARREKSHEQFRVEIEDALVEFSRSKPEAGSRELKVFSSCCYYQTGNYDSSKSFHDLKILTDKLDEERGIDSAKANRLFYLSTPPSVFSGIVAMLGQSGHISDRNDRNRWTRVIVEKPFGRDLETACALNKGLSSVLDESKIYRIDHYLGKETVQNLLALRFANLLFEPVWNATYIDHVQITVAETVGLESRVAYYDDSGALRDMVQNHMLQLLALVAMEPPTSFDATSVRDEKVKVLRALRHIGRDETVTGQYRAGAVEGAVVPGYDEELGKDSDTETFVALKAHVDNWRWKGVPFYMRTGKRLPERVTEIVIQFRCIPHSIFEGRGATTRPNRLVIGIQPEENVQMSMMAKVPGLDRDGIRLRQVPLDIAMPDAFSGTVRRIAYERLLLDLIEGDQTLFVRRDEVEAQWEWIDAIRELWEREDIKPKTYGAGSWGPSAAIALAERDGVSWHDE